MSNISQLGWTPPNLSPKIPSSDSSKKPEDSSIAPVSASFSSKMDSGGHANAVNYINSRLEDLHRLNSELENDFRTGNFLRADLILGDLDFEIDALSLTFDSLSMNNFQEAARHLEKLIIRLLYLIEVLTVTQTSLTNMYTQNQNWLRNKIETLENALNEEVKSALITQVEIIDAYQEEEDLRIKKILEQRRPDWFHDAAVSSELQEKIRGETNCLKKQLGLISGQQIAIEALKQTNDPKQMYLSLNFAQIKLHKDWRSDMEFSAQLQDQFRLEVARLEDVIRIIGSSPSTPEQRHLRVQELFLGQQDPIASLFRLLFTDISPSEFQQKLVKTYVILQKKIDGMKTELSQINPVQNQKDLTAELTNRRINLLNYFLWIVKEIFHHFCQQQKVILSLPYLADKLEDKDT